MKKDFGKNLLASIVIFLVAIPLNLGIALASGVSPAVGLLSGIIAGIVVGFMAGCPLQVSGPAAGLIAVVWQIVDSHGLEMLGPVVLAAGLLQLALGGSGLAPWFRAVAPSVIQGMLAGIGVLIFASQFQVMLDQKPQVSGLANLVAVPGAIWEVLASGNGHPSALIGILTIGTIVAWSWAPDRFKVVPGSLMGVAAAVLAAALFRPELKYVELPANPLDGIGLIPLAQLENLLSPSALGSVLALAFIATAQTLLTATAIDRMHTGERTNYNKEVVAQGLGNTVCGALGLLPISGVIVRSAANVEAGATGRWSAVLHGFWVALFLMLFSPLLGFVPLAALAAVLVYTGYRLLNIKAIKELRKFGSGGLVVYGATLATVVAVDLLTGIVFGFLLSAARLIYVLTHFELTTHQREGGLLVVEMRGSATFFTLPLLAEKLAALPAGREAHLFLSDLNHIDHACLEHLMGWEELYIQQGGQVFIEWDHLIQRFHRPRSSETTGLPTGEPRRETYDVLASRARLLRLDNLACSDSVAEAIAGSLNIESTKLRRQFAKEAFPVVRGVGLPHITEEGLSRNELTVILGSSCDHPKIQVMVVLAGPPDFSQHHAILAKLIDLAEDGLAEKLTVSQTEMSTREALIENRYLSLQVDEASQLAGKALWEFVSELPRGSLVTYVERSGKSVVPTGKTVLETGDQLLVLHRDAS